MDTFENNELDELQELLAEEDPQVAEPVEEAPLAEIPVTDEPAVQEAPAEVHIPVPEQPPVTTYRQTGTGRRESPYANSPYEMNQPRQGYTPGYTFQPQTQPKPRVKKEKKKRSLSGLGRKAVAALLVIAMVAAGCGITAGAVNRLFENGQCTFSDKTLHNRQ